ncbi:MAG: DnrO protein, partial [Luteimonas sp.]|nr:DnrO protein [Luteimonas sp.]
MAAPIVRILLPLAFAIASTPLLAQEHHDHAAAHAPAPAVAPPAQGQRWVADADLREGMGRIRVAVDELRHHEMGHMGDARATTLAEGIGRDVNWIVAHCKLEPAADA